MPFLGGTRISCCGRTILIHLRARNSTDVKQGYSLKGGDMYNLVLLCPDSLPMGVAKQAGSIDEMKELFVGWDPILTSFLNNVKTVDKWKLMHSKYAPPTIIIAGY